jgi:hypothetical protein
LAKYDFHAPNGLLFDAMAFGCAGLLIGDEEFINISKDFANKALALQRNDGVFLEKGGCDSSYQAVAILQLIQYSLLFQENKYLEVIKKGVKWMIGRVKPTGEVKTEGNTRTGNNQEQVMDKYKEVNYSEFILSLLYYAVYVEEEEAFNVAKKVWEFCCRKYGL